MSSERGEIKNILIDIEYPDGTKAQKSLNPSDHDITAIAWTEEMIKRLAGDSYQPGKLRGEGSDSWDASEWKDRPTFAVFGASRNDVDWPCLLCACTYCKPK